MRLHPPFQASATAFLPPVWSFRGPRYLGSAAIADFGTINHTGKQCLASVLIDSKVRTVPIQSITNFRIGTLAQRPHDRAQSHRHEMATGQPWAEPSPWPDGTAGDQVIFVGDRSDETVWDRWRWSGRKGITAGLDRRIGRAASAVMNDRGPAAFSRGLAEDQDERGSDASGDRRAHASPNPHELHPPVGRVVTVRHQRLGHALADRHQARRFHALFNQIIRHRQRPAL
jgi:hypothetical protein